MVPKPSSAKPQGALAPPNALQAFVLRVQTAAPLSADEVDTFRTGLIDGGRHFYEGLDGIISNTNKKRTEAEIWQVMSDEDHEYLVDTLLTAGQRVPVVAVAVRGMYDAWHKYRVGAILGPKFAQTWMFYLQNGGIAWGGN